jgi:foldase protein PrsA
VKRLAVLVVCAVALGAACSNSSSAPAATVNGEQVPTKDLVAELDAIGANNDYVSSIGGTVRGSTPGSFDAAFVAQVLLQQINYQMVHEEFGKRGLTPDDACQQQARNEVFQQLGGSSSDANAGEALFNKFPQSYQELLLRRNTELLSLEYALANQTCGVPVDAESYYKAHPEEFTKLCLSLIAVPDQAAADTVVAQARGGADFAELARQVSIDDQSKANGGDIGCRLPSEFNAQVADQLKSANVGDVLDPIAGQGGVSIVKVNDKQLQSLDDSRSTAEELATQQLGSAFSTWLAQARAGADVTIDGRYGTFDKANFTVNAPQLDASSSDQSGAPTGSVPPSSASSSGSP